MFNIMTTSYKACWIYHFPLIRPALCRTFRTNNNLSVSPRCRHKALDIQRHFHI